MKVQAVVNWIEGKRAEGQRWAAGDGDDEARAPAVFGMNFQAVSVGQKLPVGGYADAEGTPSANLLDAIAHTDASIGGMVAALARRDLLESTLIIVTAKHGQSPIDRSKLAMSSPTASPPARRWRLSSAIRRQMRWPLPALPTSSSSPTTA